jgi:hypothetical protein
MFELIEPMFVLEQSAKYTLIVSLALSCRKDDAVITNLIITEE